MSTKEWVSDQQDVGLYQECLYDRSIHKVNPNPACIQIDNPSDFKVERMTLKNGVSSDLTIEIDAKRFDELAVSWCKRRKLQSRFVFDDSYAELIADSKPETQGL